MADEKGPVFAGGCLFIALLVVFTVERWFDNILISCFAALLITCAVVLLLAVIAWARSRKPNP